MVDLTPPQRCARAVPEQGRLSPVVLRAKTIDGRLEECNPAGLSGIDGSFESDLPMQRLGELFNINHFIVAQVNPHARLLAPHESADLEDLPPLGQRVLGTLGNLVRFARDQGRS
jgi:hypothetical protein